MKEKTKTKLERVNILLDKELYERLKNYKNKYDITFTGIIKQSLKLYLPKEE